MKVAGFLIILFLVMPAFAQDSESVNDIITKMTSQLDLQPDQVSNVTAIIEKYDLQYKSLQDGIRDGHMNSGDIDSQWQSIEANETQDLSQYLKPNQLSEWRAMQAKMDQQRQQGQDQDSSDSDDDSGQYSNLPHNNSPQN